MQSVMRGIRRVVAPVDVNHVVRDNALPLLGIARYNKVGAIVLCHYGVGVYRVNRLLVNNAEIDSLNARLDFLLYSIFSRRMRKSRKGKQFLLCRFLPFICEDFLGHRNIFFCRLVVSAMIVTAFLHPLPHEVIEQLFHRCPTRPLHLPRLTGGREWPCIAALAIPWLCRSALSVRPRCHACRCRRCFLHWRRPLLHVSPLSSRIQSFSLLPCRRGKHPALLLDLIRLLLLNA